MEATTSGATSDAPFLIDVADPSQRLREAAMTSLDTAQTASHSGQPTDGPLTFDELGLAFRNRGMPLEAMVHDTTPVGLHYLVIHWDIPVADETTWRVAVDGRVSRALELSMDDLRARPRVMLPVTMECAGNGRARLEPRPISVPWLNEAIGTAEWTGTPLWPILEDAGLRDDAVEIVFHGADRGIQGDVEQTYGRSLSIEEVRRPEVMLAYEMNGRPLEPQHGFPIRLLVPGWYGMTSVKWLTRIEAVSEPFQGYQQADSYRYQQDEDDPGEPVSRQQVRALMVPPGIPDFLTRHRFVDAGDVVLSGRAWSGVAPIVRVEVSVDGAWADAELEPSKGEFAWQGWRHTWQATPGEHELACRATDAAGRVQPLEQPWNHQGMGVNHVQRVAVTVR
jgi:DMSO/TMAO reductase YedYZ molybdopterin-dependent catalytic subunit